MEEEEKRSFDLTRLQVGPFASMTVAQIGILLGMAGVLIILACVGGFLVVRNLGGDGLSQQQPPTAIPTVTSAVIASPTVTPTLTLTPVPYELLVPADWKQYKTSLVEIWLPPNFKQSSKKTSDLMNGFFATELLITEVSSKSSAYNRQVAVTYDIMTGDSLDEFLNGKFPHLAYQANVTDKRNIVINSLDARRIVIEYRANNIDYDDVVYVIQDGATVWYIQYAAEITEFFNNLPIFEQSVKTFRPVKY